jgi:hypothetical protein
MPDRKTWRTPIKHFHRNRCALSSHKGARRLVTLVNGERLWLCQDHYDAFHRGSLELMVVNGKTTLLDISNSQGWGKPSGKSIADVIRGFMEPIES